MIQGVLHTLRRNWRVALPFVFIGIFLITQFPVIVTIFLVSLGVIAFSVIAYIYVYYEKRMPERLLFLAPYLGLPMLPKYEKSLVFPLQRLADLWSETAFVERVTERVYGDEAVGSIAKAISVHLRQKTPQGALSILIAGEEQGVGKGFLKDICINNLRHLDPKLFTVLEYEGTESAFDWDEILDRRTNGKINILVYDHITPSNLGEDFLLKLANFQTNSKYADWIVFLIVADPVAQGNRDEIVVQLEEQGLDSRLSQRAKALVVKPKILPEEMGSFLAVLMHDHAMDTHQIELHVQDDELKRFHDFLIDFASTNNLTSSQDVHRAKYLIEQMFDELMLRAPPDPEHHGRHRLVFSIDTTDPSEMWRHTTLEPQRQADEFQTTHDERRLQGTG